MICGATVSTNALDVAVVNRVTVSTEPYITTMRSFSNYGPADDGRIKPHISAKGVNIYSSNFRTGTPYETLSGTSMAALAITILIVLLQQHNNNLNTNFKKAATDRGLLCCITGETRSTIKAYYGHGWGLANGTETAKLISTKGKTFLLSITTLKAKAVNTKKVSISTPSALSDSITFINPVAFGAIVIQKWKIIKFQI